jgi:CheY-like chemotaxis protein
VPTVRRLVAHGYNDVAAQPGADVLIVGAEPLITLDLGRILETCGHRVVGDTRTAADALRLVEAKHPDLVMITNVRLADDSDGWELARELQQEPARGVVILTAYPQRFLTGERPEPAFVMGKPFQPAQIVAVTAQILSFVRRSSSLIAGA